MRLLLIPVIALVLGFDAALELRNLGDVVAMLDTICLAYVLLRLRALPSRLARAAVRPPAGVLRGLGRLGPVGVEPRPLPQPPRARQPIEPLPW